MSILLHPFASFSARLNSSRTAPRRVTGTATGRSALDDLRKRLRRQTLGRARPPLTGYQYGLRRNSLRRRPLRRRDPAVAKSCRARSDFFYSHDNLGIGLQLKGDLPGAIAEFERAKQLSDDPHALALFESAKAYAGDKQAALRTLSNLNKMSQHREVLAYSRALICLGLNNKNDAMRQLEQSFAERDGSNIGWVKVDPLLDPLHGDPRFEALVQKVV